MAYAILDTKDDFLNELQLDRSRVVDNTVRMGLRIKRSNKLHQIKSLFFSASYVIDNNLVVRFDKYIGELYPNDKDQNKIFDRGQELQSTLASLSRQLGFEVRSGVYKLPSLEASYE